jgi:dipeptidyl-peptidase-4
MITSNRLHSRWSNYLLLFGLIFGLGLQTALAQSAQKDRWSSMNEALLSSYKLSGGNGPSNVNWIDGGDRYSYTTMNRETQSREIRAYNPATEEDQLIFAEQDHTFPGTDSTFSYRSFQWSSDSKYILFQTNFRPVYRNSGVSDYYFYSLEEGTMQLVAKDARTAELSPDGSKIGYERGGNLFTYDLASKNEKQLTFNDEQYVYNGRFGWVYEEEFGLAQAWEWSHDSKYIAFWQTDETDVPIFQMTDYSSQHPKWTKIPYPKVGDNNPVVKIGVVNVNDGDLNWMDTDLNGGYIPRIYWTSKEGTLAIVHLNRPQRHLKLFFNDVTTGEGKMIMEEGSDQWIDVFDFFAGIYHLFFFPEDRDEFFWISDRDGYSHIYSYDYDGKLNRQVTEGKWEVTNVYAVDSDSKRIYYSSTEDSPLERHLYSIKFNGRRKKKLTDVPGRHRIDMGPNGKYYIDRYSNVDTPRQVELWETGDKMLKKLEENAEVKEFTNQHVYAPRELFSFTTTDGQKLDGYMIKPVDFDPNKKYPLFLSIYGGPGAQGVYNQWESSGFYQYLAQQGYVTVNVNNRGSGGYGSDFEKIVYKQLGKWESKDFEETANYMAQKSWVDGDNMAIRGHSYGGYMTSYTMVTHPDVFKLGVVGAPVTDWRLYDSIYAERYMGLKDNNKEGYDSSMVMTYADSLKGRLFVAHSAMDENVHMQNTMQLMTALTSAGKDVDLRIYPPGAHGVAYNRESYLLLYNTYYEYLEKVLKQN